MRIHIRQVAAAAGTVIVLAGTAACGGGSGSSSKSSGSSGLSAGTSSGAKSAGNSSSSDEDALANVSLDGVDFCSLVDPATAAAIGFTSPGQATSSVGGSTPDGCYWIQSKTEGKTAMGVARSLGTLAGASGHIEDKDFAGFSGQQLWDDITSQCDIAVQVGVSGIRVSLSDVSRENQALAGKKCDVAADVMNKALAKIKAQAKK